MHLIVISRTEAKSCRGLVVVAGIARLLLDRRLERGEWHEVSARRGPTTRAR